jgi:hypothetical protein
MGNEAIEGSKMGSQLIMFVAIVGLALIAFLVGKNLMNTGLEQMESTVQSVNDSRFSDYNGKTVKGRAVKSAIDTFANDNVAIFVHTLAMGDDDDAMSGLSLLKAGHAGQTAWEIEPHKNSAPTTNAAAATLWEIAGVSVDTTGENPVEDTSPVLFVNYGAQLSTDGQFTFDGKIVFSRDFAISKSGNVMTNGDGSLMAKQGSAEYIANSAVFNAQLIKNSAGETIGIIFYQKKTF